MNIRNDDIKYIQNTLWAMYKVFSENHNMAEYNKQAQELCRKYRNDAKMLPFCQNLIITWAPIINGMMEAYKEGA